MTRWKYTGRSKARFYKLFGDPQKDESAFVRAFDGWQLRFASDTGEKVAFNIETMTYDISCPVTGLCVDRSTSTKSISKAVDSLLLRGGLLDKYVEMISGDVWDDIKERYAKLCESAKCHECGKEYPHGIEGMSHCPNCGARVKEESR